MKIRNAARASTAVLALTLPFTAHAQDSANIGEIIITAQKRAERLQDVPLAVTAVGADTIAARGFTNVVQVAQLSPNVSINEGIVNPTVIAPFIRGIGTGDSTPEADMPVAVSIDGVYLANIYGGLVDAFDIQQVEVLRGPQGTLQGRNAPGGAINITTRRPGDAWVVRGMAEYGRFSDVKLNLGVDGPLVQDLLGIKLAALYRHAKGFQTGLDENEQPTGQKYGGRDTLALKSGLQITPSDKIDIWLSGDYTKDKSPPTAFRDVNDGIDHPRPEYPDQLNTMACSIFNWCTPAKRHTTHQTYFGDNDITNWGVSSNINIDADAVTLTSITGYRKIKDTYVLDIDATPFPLLESRPTIVRQDTFSQEFRIASNDGGSLSMNDHIRWILGGYYMNFDMSREQHLFAFGNSIGDNYEQNLKSYALFGHIDIIPTEDLTISFGARESWDEKEFTNFTRNLNANAKWKKFMYDATVNYKLTNDQMVYARYARGSRPGGFNNSTATYNPETVDSYEIGAKTSWLDQRLTVNLTGFYYKYKDIQRQIRIFAPDGSSFEQLTGNAGASHAYGAEFEVTALPVENLRLNLSLGYLDAKYDRWDDFELIDDVPTLVDNSNLPMNHAPKWTVSAGIAYDIPINGNDLLAMVIPSVNLHHKSSHYTVNEAFPVSYEDGFSLLSAALRFEGPDQKYALTIFGDNLLNNYYIQNANNLGGLGLYVQEGRPRTYGVRLEFALK